MRSYLVRLDPVTGVELKAGAAGFGFCIFPAEGPGSAALASRNRPGGFPVTVKVYGSTEPLHVGNSHEFTFDKPFAGFSIEGDPYASYNVVVLESPGESVRQASVRSRIVLPYMSGTAQAVDTVAPAAGANGYQLRPTDRQLQFAIDGAAVDVDLYVKTAQGTWFKAETLVLAAEARPVILHRSIEMVSSIYLVASAVGATFELDVESEVG